MPVLRTDNVWMSMRAMQRAAEMAWGNARAAGIRSPTGAAASLVAASLVDPGHVRLALPKLKLLVKR